jgi:outer membrane murein-binding lipoprotein Lpp
LTDSFVEISCARFSRWFEAVLQEKFASRRKREGEREMKKFLTLVMAAVFGTVLLTGCTKKETTTTTETSTTEAPAVVEETATTMTATTGTETPAATTTTETTTTTTTTTGTKTP